jgi:hypothetical protein
VDLVSPKKRNEIKPCDDQCRVFLVAVGGTPKCTPADGPHLCAAYFGGRRRPVSWLGSTAP